MKKRCTLLLTVIAAQLVILSCGKKTTPSPLSSGCKLVTIIDTAGQSIYNTTLTYNRDGKLSVSHIPTAVSNIVKTLPIRITRLSSSAKAAAASALKIPYFLRRAGISERIIPITPAIAICAGVEWSACR